MRIPDTGSVPSPITAAPVSEPDHRDVGIAREIAILQPKLSARDCLRLAVMQANGVDRILTFDDGFSAQPDVTCLP